MAHYIWIVKAYSPRDDGWVRMHFLYDFFLNQEDGWKAVEMFWPLMERAGDYTSVDVIRTIKFKRECPRIKPKYDSITIID